MHLAYLLVRERIRATTVQSWTTTGTIYAVESCCASLPDRSFIDVFIEVVSV